MEAFDFGRYLVDQLIRPIANLYQVTPLAGGETPAGPPIVYVRQKKVAIREDTRFFADEQETRELFRIKARSVFDTGGARYDVFAGEDRSRQPLDCTRDGQLRALEQQLPRKYGPFQLGLRQDASGRCERHAGVACGP